MISMKVMVLGVILMLLTDGAFALKNVKVFKAAGKKVQVEEVARGLQIPWGFDFLSPHEMIVTERQGTIKRIKVASGQKTAVGGVPKVTASGQGGLLDIGLHPHFKKNRLLYLTYAAPFGAGHTTKLAMAKLGAKKLEQLKVLFVAKPAASGFLHYGARIAFDGQGHLFVSLGERGDRDRAQNLRAHGGKVIRLNLDGSIPQDNPFANQKNALPEIWTYGHRNPQGLVYHGATGTLWEQEHGPKGGDEINVIKKGRNYGWPIITYGREYWGPKIGTTHKKGLAQPIHHFTPSIAPSGLTIYTGSRFPRWRGDLFSGALKLTHINHLKMGKGRKVVKEYRYLEDWGRRIRNIKAGPDGYLYFSTDHGEIMRLTP